MPVPILFANTNTDVKGEFMEIGLILKIAGMGILVSIIAQILNKSGRDEQGMMLIIAGIVVTFFLLIGEIEDLFDRIKDVFEL